MKIEAIYIYVVTRQRLYDILNMMRLCLWYIYEIHVLCILFGALIF